MKLVNVHYTWCLQVTEKLSDEADGEAVLIVVAKCGIGVKVNKKVF